MTNPFTSIYTRLPLVKNNVKQTLHLAFMEGASFEVMGMEGGEFKVEFIDADKGECIHRATVERNTICKVDRRWYTHWQIRVTDGTETVLDYTLNLEGQRVYIAMDTSALGDTLAWIPFVEEFGQKHKCKIVCATAFNHLLRESYPEIEFVELNTPVSSLLAAYTLGAFHPNKKNLCRVDFNKVPLQHIAAHILGLEPKEVKPRVKWTPTVSTQKYVCIATESTAQCKHWNNPDGWKEVAAYLHSNGYNVLNVSESKEKIPGVGQLKSHELPRVIASLAGAKFLVGLPSGLSWLAWAMDIPVVMVSGFSEPWTEFQSGRIRVGPENGVCSGCYNKHVFDRNDFAWCPEHKGTNRAFECTKTITPERVIEALAPLING